MSRPSDEILQRSNRVWSRAAVVVVVVATMLVSRVPARGGVTGDCDGDGVITIAELVRGVSIALGAVPLGDCLGFDANGDGAVRIDELVVAVAYALREALNTPTASATASETATLTAAPMATASQTAVATATPSLTVMPSSTPTTTMTAPPTHTHPHTATATRSVAATSASSRTSTRTGTATSTRTSPPSASPTRTSTASRTRTLTATPVSTATATRTTVPMPTPTNSPTSTPAPAVLDFGVVGGQACGETSFKFIVRDDLPVQLTHVHIDVCLDATVFDVVHATCTSFSPTAILETPVFQDHCEIGAGGGGQLQIDISGGGDPGTLQPGDRIECSLPVFPTAAVGSYPVQFQLVAQSTGGELINRGQNQIMLFPSSYPIGACCGLDSQCESGFCRGGAPGNQACCESDCGGGICNSPTFGLGACCGALGTPACP